MDASLHAATSPDAAMNQPGKTHVNVLKWIAIKFVEAMALAESFRIITKIRRHLRKR
jgi:hypothetical protein